MKGPVHHRPFSLGLPTLYATLYIRRETGAATPVTPAAAFLLLLIAGFLLSLL